MSTKKKLFILDPGHGGILNGVPQTEGKRSPKWEDIPQLFEGEFTRSVVGIIMSWAPLFGIECINLVPEIADISLKERVRKAHEHQQQFPDKQCVLISVHANAGGGHGIEVFTSPGMTSSDAMATIFVRKFEQAFPKAKMRTDLSDGDPDKEAGFYMLTKTAMPAILTENFFMDNYNECKEYLLTIEGRMNIAMAHVAAMAEIDGG